MGMDIFLQEENIKKKQRNENRERKRRLKKFLKEQEAKFAPGGHDRSGTRVRDDTPLPAPAIICNTISYDSSAGGGGDTIDSRVACVQETPSLPSPKSPKAIAAVEHIETGVGTNIHEILPSKPTRTTPIDSKRAVKPRTCHILKNEQQVLGQGAFGVVYMGISTLTGELVAVKEIMFRSEKKDAKRQIEKLVREVGLMKVINHANIVRYYGAERSGKTLQIFMEYVPGGSLKSIIRRFGKLHESMMKIYLKQILSGLAYLHQAEVLHLDIKSDNALLGVTGEVKLADFGASAKLEDVVGSKEVVGTPAFMAPEVVRGTGYSYPADVWSVGITIHELVVGEPPTFGMTDPLVLMYRIASCTAPPDPPEVASPELKDFLSLCLQRHPLDRMTAPELLVTPYLHDIGVGDDEDTQTPQTKPQALPTMAIIEPTDTAAVHDEPRSATHEPDASRPPRAAFDVDDGDDDANHDRERDRPVVHGSACGDSRAIEAFVDVSGKKAVTNSKEDMSYLRDLGKEKRKGVMSDFEVNTKKSALFGIKAFEPLKQCGLTVEDLRDEDIIDL